MLRSILKVLLTLGPWLLVAPAQAEPLRFGVVNQRSPQLTAQYWNPILEHVSLKSGVSLELRMGKTAPESTAMAVRGEVDFAYTNHLFTPDRSRLGWRVIARMAGDPIAGAIVVAEQSLIRSLADLQGSNVVFPSRDAFLGYWVPMDALLRSATPVTPLFAGNAEGAMGQLRAGAVAAAGVNAKVMAEFAERENFRYRTIWHSDRYLDLALMVHPRVAPSTVDAVRAAFLAMAHDAQGRRVLEVSAELIRQKPPFGFVLADNKDYDNYRRFFRTTSVKPLSD